MQFWGESKYLPLCSESKPEVRARAKILNEDDQDFINISK